MGVVEGVGSARPARHEPRTRIDAATLAWLTAIPCALLSIAAIALLGPPLGHALHAGASAGTFWQEVQWAVLPEPAEQGRFLLALAAPIALALGTGLAARRAPRISSRTAALGVPLAQALGAGVLIACVVVQERLRFEVPIYQATVVHRWRYFTPPTLVAAAALAAVAAFALWRAPLRARLAAWTRETPARKTAALALAILLTAIWMLHAVNTDASILGTSPHEWQPSGFTLDETYAVLDGRTPLVDFTAQYASLLPYLTALSLLAFGKTFLVFSIAMCTITSLALLAIFALLRRVTRNALTALVLYLPFLATSLFKVGGTSTVRYTWGDYFGMYPLRYAGPFLLAWLTARQLDRERPAAGAWPLFAVAGLVVLNNVEFGIAALGASVAALIWTAPERDRRWLGRLAGQLGLGLAAALALLCVLTLARAGELPQLGRLLDYARAYAVGGFGLLPLPGVLGFHLVVYLTYVAAIGTATARAIDGERDRLLTGMLAWSGIFGLGSASYYMGRTHPEALIATFSVWTLTLALLAVVVVRGLAARPSRRPSIAALAVLAGMGLAACSLVQLPLPWTQIDRLQAGTPATALGETAPPPSFPRAFMPAASTRDFFASMAEGSRFYVKRGAPVAILLTSGHEIADAFGVLDVSRYTGMYSIVTRERLETVVRDLRAAGGNTLLLPSTYREAYELLAGLGFAPLTANGLGTFTAGTAEEDLLRVPWGETMVTKWIDTHGLHPRFLRGAPGRLVASPG